MTKLEGDPVVLADAGNIMARANSRFVIRASLVIRHSFGLRHSGFVIRASSFGLRHLRHKPVDSLILSVLPIASGQL
jgi:hypothetical protein